MLRQRQRFAAARQTSACLFTFFMIRSSRLRAPHQYHGNNLHADEVIRREMRHSRARGFRGQGGASKRRVTSRYSPKLPSRTPQWPHYRQVDVNITSRAPNGYVLLGAGFGSGEGLIMSARLAEQHLRLGKTCRCREQHRINTCSDVR